MPMTLNEGQTLVCDIIEINAGAEHLANELVDTLKLLRREAMETVLYSVVQYQMFLICYC